MLAIAENLASNSLFMCLKILRAEWLGFQGKCSKRKKVKSSSFLRLGLQTYTVSLLPYSIRQSSLFLPKFKEGDIPTSRWEKCQINLWPSLTYPKGLCRLGEKMWAFSCSVHKLWLRFLQFSSVGHCDTRFLGRLVSELWFSEDFVTPFEASIRLSCPLFPASSPSPKKLTKPLNCYCLFFLFFVLVCSYLLNSLLSF